MYNTTHQMMFEKNLIRKANDGIEEIVPLIHQTKFTGDYTYKKIEKKLGKPFLDHEYSINAIKRK